MNGPTSQAQVTPSFLEEARNEASFRSAIVGAMQRILADPEADQVSA